MAEDYARRARDAFAHGDAFDEGLILSGGKGTGKTLIASCVVKECGGLLALSIDILSDLKDSYDGDGGYLHDRCFKEKLLVIDDLGSEKRTEKNAEWLR